MATAVVHGMASAQGFSALVGGAELVQSPAPPSFSSFSGLRVRRNGEHEAQVSSSRGAAVGTLRVRAVATVRDHLPCC